MENDTSTLNIPKAHPAGETNNLPQLPGNSVKQQTTISPLVLNSESDSEFNSYLGIRESIDLQLLYPETGSEVNEILAKLQLTFEQIHKIIGKKDNSKLNYDNKKVKTAIKEFQEFLLIKLNQVAMYYSYEEVMMLSLSYDCLGKLRDLKVNDFEMVEELYEELNMVSNRIKKLMHFANSWSKNLQNLFHRYRELFPKIFSEDVFKKFCMTHFHERGNSLKKLIEREGLFKSFTTVIFTKTKIDPEVRKALQVLKHSELATSPEASEYLARLSKIKKLSSQVQAQLDELEPYFQDPQVLYWKNIGFNFSDFSRLGILRYRIQEFFEDHGLSKDDYINAYLNPIDRERDDYEEVDATKPCTDMTSLWLVLFHTMVYMINYYGMYPTFFEQKAKLNISMNIAFFLLAVTPATAMVVINIYDKWFKSDFKGPYYLSCGLLMIGNLLYYSSTIPHTATVATLVIGRMLLGAGGIRYFTRKYMALMINEKFRAKYTAIFFVISNVGKCIGPGISTLLLLFGDVADGNSKYIHDGNTFSLFCAVLWFIYFILIHFSFKRHRKLVETKIIKMKRLAKVEAKFYHDLLSLQTNEIKLLTEAAKNRSLERADEAPARIRSPCSFM